MGFLPRDNPIINPPCLPSYHLKDISPAVYTTDPPSKECKLKWRLTHVAGDLHLEPERVNQSSQEEGAHEIPQE